ncbi:hypothetical protein D3C76_569340 [compost metagenome]
MRDAAVVRRCMNAKSKSATDQNVGAGLLAKAVYQALMMSTDTPSSRASPLPHCPVVVHKYHLPNFTLVQPRVMIRCTAIGWSGTAYKVAITASGGYEPGSLRIASSTNGVAAALALL